jgi:NADPH:quinone reductase-like Zn-dependent oxidoreductase
MKAFVVDRYGKTGNTLRAGDMPEPAVGEHDVLVQVHAAGVNALDSKIRNGDFKLFLPYRPPFVLGNDVAGVVVRAGARVREFKPGDEVYARPDKDRIGTFAEFIAVHEDDLALKPRRLTMAEAASVPLVGLTAWQALIERAQLRTGQKVFIQAGAGGVGTFAIQLAKHLGATVATTTSTANADLVERLGADIVIDYRKDDFETVLHDYDVVLHSLGNAELKKSLRVLKPGGKLISLSGPPDPDFAREMGKPWILRPATRVLSQGIRTAAKRRQVDYSFLFMRAGGAQLREIASLIDDGVIEPVVDRVFPFDATNEAMAYVEQGHAKGKVVVAVRPAGEDVRRA